MEQIQRHDGLTVRIVQTIISRCVSPKGETEMHSDDKPVGRLYTRREAMTLLGASSAALLTDSLIFPLRLSAFTRMPCVVRPRQTAGPYFVDGMMNRSDIRSDPANGEIKQGVPLALTFLVTRLNGSGCDPLPGAQVDVWQCDAHGVYSDVQDRRFDTQGRKFLRGYQITDGDGTANFTTIYPGWYPGRTVHIHFKIRTEPSNNRSYEFISQLYFDDDLTDRIYVNPPYSDRRGTRTRNQNDRIYRRGGDQLELSLTSFEEGYTTTFDIALHIPE
jgi:protocatechuate 3,4-dioxygenase beta subunit